MKYGKFTTESQLFICHKAVQGEAQRNDEGKIIYLIFFTHFNLFYFQLNFIGSIFSDFYRVSWRPTGQDELKGWKIQRMFWVLPWEFKRRQSNNIKCDIFLSFFQSPTSTAQCAALRVGDDIEDILFYIHFVYTQL